MPLTREEETCYKPTLELTGRLAERCRSGRTGRFRKPLSPQGFPGFESLPLRQPFEGVRRGPRVAMAARPRLPPFGR